METACDSFVRLGEVKDSLIKLENRRRQFLYNLKFQIIFCNLLSTDEDLNK